MKQTAPLYMKKVVDLLRSGRIKRGEAGVVQVLHDDGCQILKGFGACDCNPEVRLEADEPTQTQG